jgi:hypothetical protein
MTGFPAFPARMAQSTVYPAIRKLEISGPESGFMVSILDMQGRAVVSQQMEEGGEIDMINFPAGTYLASMHREDGPVIGTYRLLKVE